MSSGKDWILYEWLAGVCPLGTSILYLIIKMQEGQSEREPIPRAFEKFVKIHVMYMWFDI